MNKQVSDKCDQTAVKIIDIIDGLGFTVENKKKVYELRTLITNEVRHCVSDVATDFYNNAALVPTSIVETEEFANGETNPDR